MLFLAKLIMFVIVVYGFVLLLNPKAVKALFAFAKKWDRKKANLVGTIRIIVGAILLSSAAASRIPGLVTFFGLLAIAAGIAAFLVSKDFAIRYIEWWETKPQNQQKLVGVIAIAFGAIILIGL